MNLLQTLSAGNSNRTWKSNFLHALELNYNCNDSVQSKSSFMPKDFDKFFFYSSSFVLIKCNKHHKHFVKSLKITVLYSEYTSNTSTCFLYNASIENIPSTTNQKQDFLHVL